MAHANDLEHAKRLCSLSAIAGKREACPDEGCPFWEPGGAARGGRCALAEFGGVTDEAVAVWLLEIRDKLGAAGSAEEEHATRSAFHHLLNDSSE